MKTLQPKMFYNKLFLVIMGLIIIFNSGHALVTIAPFVTFVRNAMILGGICFIPSIIHAYFSNKVNMLLMSFLSLMGMIFFTYLFHFGESTGPYVYILFAIMFAFGITLTYSFEDFARIFQKLMVITSVIALIGYFLLKYTSLLNVLPKFTNNNYSTYGVGIIWNYIVHLPDRNCGMFWEPGVFATFLIYAIIFELFFNKDKISIIRLALFSLCIFTANSAGGFFLWLVCLILFFMKSSKGKKRNPLVYLVVSIIFVLGIVVILNLDYIILNTRLVNNQYFVKLLSESVLGSSRYYAISHNIEIFINNPIFGGGYKTATQQMASVADTSTSTYLLSVFGILGSSYTIFFIYGIVKNRSNNTYAKICVIIIILSIINKEPHMGIVFTWCFLFYLIKESSLDKTRAFGN